MILAIGLVAKGCVPRGIWWADDVKNSLVHNGNPSVILVARSFLLYM